ncbi:hypothetical protein [Chryseobacterium fistulae]|uniref:Lipoprotein n=1 Tax=Chryseobacterium fistulae TaxID=2675058 RepID=A0A6N4XPR2_9FLAO|nr:hypothetical protein [Chryseobacterium fistulae]CAA7387173.1 hypothetical protein CHRY9393_01480 [Chryseobacterium fistulae]
MKKILTYGLPMAILLLFSCSKSNNTIQPDDMDTIKVAFFITCTTMALTLLYTYSVKKNQK